MGRGQLRVLVFRAYPKCPLCGAKPTDLHEIVPRSALDCHLLPMELHVALCHRCNMNEWTIRADSAAGRMMLTAEAINKWGIDRMKAAYEAILDFHIPVHILKPIGEVLSGR